MYRLFKSNQPFVALFIPLLSALLLCLSYWAKTPVAHMDLSLGFSWDGLQYPWVILLISTVVISATALMLNRFFIKATLISVKNFIPAVIYTVLASSVFHWTGLTWPFIANLFLILSFLHFYSTYDKISVLDSHFRAGFWLGIASLMVPSYLIYLLVFFFLTLRNRAFLITEFIALFIGLLAPWFYLFVYHYFFLDVIKFPLILSVHWVPLNVHIMEYQFSYYLMNFWILILFFSGLFYFLYSYQSNIKKMLVSKNSLFPILWISLIFTILSVSLPENFGFISTALPLTIIISFNFLENIHNKIKSLFFNLFLFISVGICILNIVYKY